MIKRWTLKPADEQITDHLHDVLKVNPVLCRLLTIRGITDYDSAKTFFRPDLSQLHDPMLMKGMREAVSRIKDAFEWHEKILVYGDYD
ncbi:MAG: single-stranded-DNA-specific exonuclease RecJ, partial [Chitinophagales bacterium]|nr:single-stranded-DNA-specific exonuclease RecJ [Chitinophagales bacterium]